MCVCVCRAMTGLSQSEPSFYYSQNVGRHVVDLRAVLVSHHHSLSGSGVGSEHHAILHKTHTHGSFCVTGLPRKNHHHRNT